MPKHRFALSTTMSYIATTDTQQVILNWLEDQGLYASSLWIEKENIIGVSLYPGARLYLDDNFATVVYTGHVHIPGYHIDYSNPDLFDLLLAKIREYQRMSDKMVS